MPQGHSLTGVKWQVLRLMRMLVEITNTLEQVGAARLRCTARPYCCAALRFCCAAAMCPPNLAAAMWMRARQHPPANHCSTLQRLAHCSPPLAAPPLPAPLLLPPPPSLQVPSERYLFMKLTYTDETPDEYEPPMFGPAPDGGVGCFSRMPFVM